MEFLSVFDLFKFLGFFKVDVLYFVNIVGIFLAEELVHSPIVGLEIISAFELFPFRRD